MSWTSGEKLTLPRMKRLSSSIPSSYTVYKDGTTYMAECNVSGGSDFSGTDAATVFTDTIAALTDGGVIYVKSGMHAWRNTLYALRKLTFCFFT